MSRRDADEQVGDDAQAFLDALEDLDGALDVNLERLHDMRKRIAEIRGGLERGYALREIVPNERPPLLVELLTQSADALHAYGSRVRRTEARALHRDGLTMDQIARLFGVTRQRVSALLREKR